MVEAFTRFAITVFAATVLTACGTHRGGLAQTQALTSAQPARPAANPPQMIESHDQRLAAALREAAAVSSPAHLRNVAAEYRRLGLSDMAFEYYSRALRVDRADAAAYDGLARIWRDWGMLNPAMANASRAVYYAPTSATSYGTLGTVMQAAGNRREARQAYEKALKYDPRAAFALTNLCYLSFLDMSIAAALGECRDALAIAPGSTAARNNLALAYAAGGDFDTARQEFEQAGDGVGARYNMGILYMASRQYLKAAQAFDEALNENPQFTLAAQRARQARRSADVGEQHQ